MFQGISPQNMAKHMVRLRTSILGSWRSPIDFPLHTMCDFAGGKKNPPSHAQLLWLLQIRVRTNFYPSMPGDVTHI